MNLLKNRILLILFVSISVFTSCDMEDDANAKKDTLNGLVSDNDDFDSLQKALEVTDLSTTLSGTETFTLFAPTDTAFENFLAENDFATIEEVPTSVLRQILLNHLVAGKIKQEDLPINAYINSQATGFASNSANLSMYFRNVSGETEINGIATVTNGNIYASNGVIHKVDAVLKLPTIIDHIIANPNLSTLSTALESNDQFDFIAELSSVNNGPYTMIAPMNTAFSSLLVELNQPNLAAIGNNTLAQVLKYHFVITTNAFSSSLTDGTSISTYAGDSFSIQSTPANFRIVDINDRLSNITTRDIQCYNGMIHMVDRVLLPNLD